MKRQRVKKWIGLEILEQRCCPAGISFVAHEIECCAERSGVPLTADLDADGDLDLLIQEWGEGISWLENDGTAFFNRRHVIDPRGYGLMLTADVDGDGDTDIIANDYDQYVVWYENIDGRGAFANGVLISHQIESIRSVADLDGDGDVDLITTPSHDTIVLYENVDGRGTFQPNQTIQSNLVRSVHAVDFDSDGDLDLLVSRGNWVLWYPNTDGSWDFGNGRVFITGSPHSLVKPADVDGDGDFDLIIAANRYDVPAGIFWHENIDGLGSFSPAKPVTTGIQASSLSVGDINGDGFVDFMFGHRDEIRWYVNVGGSGEFDQRQSIEVEQFSHRSGRLADLDADGDLDLLFIKYAQITWYENLDGLGTFDEVKRVTQRIERAHPAHLADIDGDGDSDLILQNAFAVVWYENKDSEGEFSRQRTIGEIVGAIGEVVGAILPGDLDTDGDPDIIVATRDEILWYENIDGQGNFAGVAPLGRIKDFVDGDLLAADFDADGDLDLLFATEKDVAWYENADGRGTLGTKHVVPTDTPLISLADIDLDGDLDVLGQNQWYENIDGQGTFGRTHNVSISDSFRLVGSADLDNDGDNDLYAVSKNRGEYNGPGRIIWLRNLDGRATFSEPIAIPTDDVDAVRNLQAVDLDGDGDLDLASGTGNSNWYPSSIGSSLTWFENLDGLGDFHREHTIRLDAGAPISVVADDIDNDGDSDLLTVNRQYGAISWYENRVLGDINDDGIFDSADLVAAFQAGEYQDRGVSNSSFEEGDWNGDGEFNSSDFVFALQAGMYARDSAMVFQPRSDDSLEASSMLIFDCRRFLRKRCVF